MPNYNHAPYLKERMDSILAQDYSNIELIVLDDASTDDSWAVLQTYADNKRVKLMVRGEQNSGNTFVQWKKGLEAATGEYVWIAESDDVAEPMLVSCLMKAIEQNDAVVAFSNSVLIDSEGREIGRRHKKPWTQDFSMDGKDFVRRYLLGYNNIYNASAVLFSREAALRVDMDQVAQFKASGDRLFWIEMAMQGRVAYIARCLNRFRKHAHKVSNNAESRAQNIIEDHAIYTIAKQKVHVRPIDKWRILAYHWRAMIRSAVSKEGRLQAMKAWRAEVC